MSEFTGHKIEHREKKGPKRSLLSSFIILGLVFLCLVCLILARENPSHKVAKKALFLKTTHPDFVGRKEHLKRIEKALITQRTTGVPVIVVWGEGGTGKTETAIAFANRYKKKFSFIYSVNSSTQESYSQSYRDLATRLGLLFDPKEEIERTVRRVHFYLETSQFTKPWLLLLDNVEEGILLPDRGSRSVLLTTRDKTPWIAYDCLALENFSQKEGLELFEKVLKKKPGKATKALVKDLECFPLALGIAAHYLCENPDTSENSYLKSIQREKDSFLHQSSHNLRYPYSIAACWKITLDRLLQTEPLALECLKFCACLYPERIPKSWVEEWLQLRREKSSSVAGKRKNSNIIQALVNQALLKYNEKEESFSTHRLKQGVIQEWNTVLPHTQKEVLAFLAKKVEGLEEADAIEWSGESPASLHVWAMNSNWFLEHYGQNSPSHELAKIFNALGNYYVVIEEKYQKGIEHYEKSIQVKEKIFGKCADPSLLMTLCNLGGGYYFLANPERSLHYYAVALEMASKISQDKPSREVAKALLKKGSTLHWYGSTQESLKCLLEALSIYQQFSQDENSLDLVEVLKWVGGTYSSLGEHKKALEYLEKALAINRQVNHGRPNIQLAYILYNRGSTWFRMGQWEAALEAFKENLKIEKQFSLTGESNFRCVHVLNTLGNIYCHLKQYKKAIASAEEGLRIAREVFPDKPNYLIANGLRVLGNAYYNQGYYTKAEELLEESLQVCRELSKDTPHLFTIRALNGLGEVYFALQRKEEGIQYFKEALEMAEKLYEKKPHQDIAEILGCMGKSYLKVDNRKTLEYLNKSYQMYLVTVGEKHPATKAIAKELKRSAH